VQQDRDAVMILAERPESVVREMLLRDKTLHGLEISTAALEDAFLALTTDPVQV
jgi:ABC-2 type transport system ATP-binding protein